MKWKQLVPFVILIYPRHLAMDKDFVDHDTVEEWAEFIYDEINHESLLMM